MQLVGYDKVPDVYALADDQKKWFEQLETEIGKEIVIEMGNLKVKKREDDFEKSGIVRIFDQSASMDQGTGDARWTGMEEITLDHPDELGLAPGTRRKGSFLLRQNHGIRKLNEDHAIFSVSDGEEDTSAVAEMDYGTIWMRFALMNFKRLPESPIAQFQDTAKNLDYFVKPMFAFILEKDGFEALRRERHVAVRNAFIDYMSKHATVRMDELVTTVTNDEKRAIEAEQNARDTHRALVDHKREYDALADGAHVDTERMEHEYEELMSNDKMDHLEFDGKAFHMYTTETYLYSPDRKTRTPAGKFKFTMNISGGEQVTLHNLTNQCGGRNHPHVPADGHPCWGNSGNSVFELVRKHELFGLFELLIDYVESYNPEDTWARWAANWWVPQKDKLQQWLQPDGKWLTLPELEKLEKEGKLVKSGEATTTDTELTAEIDEQLAPVA